MLPPSTELTLVAMLLRALGFLAGLLLVFDALRSALRTFVLPRSAGDRITRLLFTLLRRGFDRRVRRKASYAERDRIMAFFAPLGLMLLLPVWLSMILVGYMAMFWAVGVRPLYAAFVESGSSLFTLGFERVDGVAPMILTFSESTIGLILVALLIAYLPTMYGAFARREQAVTLLEVRAGAPPSALEMIRRFHRLGRMERLDEMWATWEVWFAEIEESHTSLAALVFFRSPQPDHSWVTAAGAVLDAAALRLALVDLPHTDVQAQLCLRAGYIALRRIADFFALAYNPDPHFPADPISVSREDFDAACAILAADGVPLVADLDRAWQAFAGWRVNYDATLIGFCRMTMAPSAPWSSDRAGIDALLAAGIEVGAVG
ncbi:MAG: hypothetical protein KDH92_10055 [Chloroflexi bacterium]|nr:hypothetical protein [Chloroflexota bacterium]